MARLTRIHVPGGLYYVHLRGNGGQAIFAGAQDYYDFCALVGRAARRSRARVHAYCWMWNTVRLAVEISDVPVGRLVQRIAAQHSRDLHRKLGSSGHLFERGYRALLMDADPYLPELVRHIHLTPVRAGAASEAAEYAWSSHRAYLRLARVPWLTTHVVMRRLKSSSTDALDAYRKFMTEANEAVDTERFDRSKAGEPRVLGGEQFLKAVAIKSRPKRRAGTLEQIIDGVARLLDVPRGELLSASRRRRLSLARALVTWHATRSGIATLAEVSRRLSRDPSTLYIAMERYRVARRDLFTDALPGLPDREAESWRLLLRRV